MRSPSDRLGDRCRERFTIRSWCFRRSDSATSERTPPGPSNRASVAIKWITGNGQIAHRRIVAGWEILRNHGRNNNSPGTRIEVVPRLQIATSQGQTQKGPHSDSMRPLRIGSWSFLSRLSQNGNRLTDCQWQKVVSPLISLSLITACRRRLKC